MQQSISKIAVAGSGNVAWHLSEGLMQCGYQISSVWSRNQEHAKAFAEELGAKCCNQAGELCIDSDVIVIAVSDAAIAEIAQQLSGFKGIVVHTAGSVGMDVFYDGPKHCGVVYPLQTFSKGITVKLSEVPFFVEANTEEVLSVLNEMVSKLSAKIYVADSQQRMLLHVAAVFAGNYSNLMYGIGNKILDTAAVPHDVLYPLIAETARKALSSDPLNTQTGPARRNDRQTLETHLEALAGMPAFAMLYDVLARTITETYK